MMAEMKSRWGEMAKKMDVCRGKLECEVVGFVPCSKRLPCRGASGPNL